MDERMTAARALLAITERGGFGNLTLQAALAGDGLTARQKAFVTYAVNGVLRNMVYIDWMLARFCKPAKTPPFVVAILRLGAYQLKMMDGAPDYAVCDQMVDLCKRGGFAGLSGLVNGVLRNLARHTGDWRLPEEPAAYLRVRYSCPEWLVRRLIAAFGYGGAKAALQTCAEPPDVSICVNTLKTTAPRLAALLEAEGVSARPGKRFPNALRLTRTADVAQLAPFTDGLFHVMDESALAAAATAIDQGADSVTDVCAAPGGKSFAMAYLTGGLAAVSARDNYPHKIKLLADGVKRLGLSNVTPRLKDALAVDPADDATADAALIDAPCSGLGLLRGKPDVRLRKAEQDLIALADIQKRIIHAAWRIVKPGGALTYSVCTVTAEETTDIADWVTANLPFGEVERELIPPGETDGFFIAKFIRKG